MLTFPRPQRTKHTTWENDTPISDSNEAISLLAHNSSSSEPVHLTRFPYDCEHEWEIVVPWYHEGSSGADSAGWDYFQIDQELAARLVRAGIVEPYKILYLGGSRVDQNRFVLPKELKTAAYQRERELIEKAKRLLVPGVHTDLAGEAQRCGSGREHWRFGRFYVDFETPLGGEIRVFPEQEEVCVK